MSGWNVVPLVLLLVIIGGIACYPVALGIIAKKRAKPVPLYITVGMAIGMGAFALAVYLQRAGFPLMAVLPPVLLLGVVLLVTALLIKKPAPKETQVTLPITLPMPLPPGHSD